MANTNRCCFRYTVQVKVEEKQPYRLRTYTWCWAFPPRCSKYKIQIRTIYRTEVGTQPKEIQFDAKNGWNSFKTADEELERR